MIRIDTTTRKNFWDLAAYWMSIKWIYFKMPSHSYPTRFSSFNYNKRKTRLRKSRLRISIRGPPLWNNFVATTEKELESSSLFKSKVITKFLDFGNELTFFWNKCKGYFCFVLLLLLLSFFCIFFIISKIRYITTECLASFNNYWLWGLMTKPLGLSTCPFLINTFTDVSELLPPCTIYTI